MAHGSKRPSDDLIVEALRKYDGLMTQAAESLGVSRMTLWRWVQDTPALQDVCKEAREVLLDVAESKLKENINKGDSSSIAFFLKNIGRPRGFGDKLDVSSSEGVKVIISEDESKL